MPKDSVYIRLPFAKLAVLAFVASSATADQQLATKVAPSPSGSAHSQHQPASALPDDELLTGFRGRLLAQLPSDHRQTRAALRSALLNEFSAKQDLIRTRFPELSERQRLVMFTLLRVHGSFPTYAIRSMVPASLDRLLLSHRGNCSDHAIRLALALDALDIETAFVPIKTASLPGHVVVDAYDPIEHTAYLLDSNTNVLIRRPGASASFLTEWVNERALARTEFFSSAGNFYELPMHYDYEDPGPLGFTGAAPTLEQLNSTVKNRKDLWRRAFTTEFGQVLGWWKTSWPYQPPRSLIELGHAFDLIGLIQFQPHRKVPTRPLWAAADLSHYDPSRHVSMPAQPLED